MSTKGLIRSNNRKGVRSGKASENHAESGRVILTGAFVLEHEDEIRHRLHNVSEHAAGTRPERAGLAIERNADGLVVTTPTKFLAQRVVREMGKAFHGQATLRWSETDNSLLATWTREQ